MYNYSQLDYNYSHSTGVCYNLSSFGNLPYVLNVYLLPLIIVVGIVGNCVSIVVFAGASLNKVSSSIYVIAVLSSDTGLLITFVFVWIDWLDVVEHGMHQMNGVCRFSIYFSYVCSFLSAWYIVCITVENYITICHPTYVRIFCTRFRAKFVTFSIAVSALSFYSFALYTSELRMTETGPQCSTGDDFLIVHAILTYIDSFITLLMPLISITLLMILFTVRVLGQVRRKRKMTNDSRHFKASSMPQVRVTRMMFVLSLSFLLLNLPSHAFKLVYLIMSLADVMLYPDCLDSYINHIIVFISYGNVSIKFFILLACCNNFRKPIKKWFYRSEEVTREKEQRETFL